MTLRFLIIIGLVSTIYCQSQKRPSEPHLNSPVLSDDDDNKDPNSAIQNYQLPNAKVPYRRQEDTNGFRRQPATNFNIYPQNRRQFSENIPSRERFINADFSRLPQFSFPGVQPPLRNEGGNTRMIGPYPTINRPPYRIPSTSSQQNNPNIQRIGSFPYRDNRPVPQAGDYEDDYPAIHENFPPPSPHGQQRGNLPLRRQHPISTPKTTDYEYDYDASTPSPKKPSKSTGHLSGPSVIYHPGIGYIPVSQYEQSHKTPLGPSSLSLQGNYKQGLKKNKLPEYYYEYELDTQKPKGSNEHCATPSGKFGDPSKDCTIFYTCQKDGRVDTGTCPDNTKFNNHVYVCDYSYKIDANCNPLPGFDQEVIKTPANKNSKSMYEINTTPSYEDYMQDYSDGTSKNKHNDYY